MHLYKLHKPVINKNKEAMIKESEGEYCFSKNIRVKPFIIKFFVHRKKKELGGSLFISNRYTFILFIYLFFKVVLQLLDCSPQDAHIKPSIPLRQCCFSLSAYSFLLGPAVTLLEREMVALLPEEALFLLAGKPDASLQIS